MQQRKKKRESKIGPEKKKGGAEKPNQFQSFEQTNFVFDLHCVFTTEVVYLPNIH